MSAPIPEGHRTTAKTQTGNEMEIAISCQDANRIIAALEAQLKEAIAVQERMADNGILRINETVALEAQLSAMTADRDLWRDAHNDDCPNQAMVAELEAQNRQLLYICREFAARNPKWICDGKEQDPLGAHALLAALAATETEP